MTEMPLPVPPAMLEVFQPPSALNLRPMTPSLARALPAVARALKVYSGLAKQMPLEAYRGAALLPRPTVLNRPDPDRTTASFIEISVEDYLLHGNAVAWVSVRAADGYPLALRWLPASRCTLTVDPVEGRRYWYDGIELNTEDVIHVRRGGSDWTPERGIGVVEQHLRQLGKADAQESYEARTLDSGAVPSVAIIAPNPDLRQEEADKAKEDWVAKYGGSVRKPAVLPAGTEVVPLAWSPADAEMTEARKLSLLDIANIFNLDGYWVGAPTASMTYRSPAPMYVNLLRQSVGPVLVEFEQTWGHALLPRGTDLRFRREVVLTDDMGTMLTYAGKAVADQILTPNEAREWIGKPAIEGGDTMREATAIARNNQKGNTDD